MREGGRREKRESTRESKSEERPQPHRIAESEVSAGLKKDLMGDRGSEAGGDAGRGFSIFSVVSGLRRWRPREWKE